MSETQTIPSPEATVVHAPGTFCWWEIATTDLEAARAFYTTLFGWTSKDNLMDEGQVYVLFHHEGNQVAGLYQLAPEQLRQGTPPQITSYIATETVDETVKSAEALGGKVLMGPLDVYDHGRMAFLEDPTGAPFGVWEARGNPGSESIDAPGSVCWNELTTKDTQVAGAFYARLFDYLTVEKEMGEMVYTTFQHGEKSQAGMMEMCEAWGEMPSHWMPYFRVTDCGEAGSQAQALGATLKVPPTDIPNIGRFAVIQDPQGVVFSIIALEAVA